MAGLVISPEIRYRDTSGQFLAECDAAGVEAIAAVGEEGATLAQAIAPRGAVEDPRTESIVDSIEFEQHGMSGRIIAQARHAAAQELGAGPHPIGQPGQHLSNRATGWYGRGVVSHPGNPPQPYLRPAYEILRGKMIQIMSKFYPG